MSFQKCPICDGSGTVSTPVSFNTSPTCPTCKGSRMIDELTGTPPLLPSTSQQVKQLEFDFSLGKDEFTNPNPYNLRCPFGNINTTCFCTGCNPDGTCKNSMNFNTNTARS